MHATKSEKTGRYYTRFRIGKTPFSYTSEKIFPLGLSKKDANLIAHAIYLQKVEELRASTIPLLADCIDKFLVHCEAKGLKGMSNIANHADAVKNFCKPSDTIEDVARVGNAMREYMLSTPSKRGTPFSKHTIKKRLYIIRRTAKLAFKEWDILEADLGAKIVNPPQPRARDRFLTHDECRKLLANCDNEEVQLQIEFHILTGIRNAELRRLEAGDLNGNRLTIDGKTDRFRSFSISNRACEVFDAMQVPVKIHYDTKISCFRRACNKAGLEDVKPHDLRHTFASLLAQSGKVSLHQLQQVMGHASINQTLDYARLMPEHLNDVATQISL